MNNNKPDQSEANRKNKKKSSPREKSLGNLEYNEFIKKFAVEGAELEPEKQSPQETLIVIDKPKASSKKPQTASRLKLDHLPLLADKLPGLNIVDSNFLKLFSEIDTRKLDDEEIGYIRDYRLELESAVYHAIKKSENRQTLTEDDWDAIYEAFLVISDEMENFFIEKRNSIELYLGLELLIIANISISSVPEFSIYRDDLRICLEGILEILKESISDKDLLLLIFWEITKIDLAGIAKGWEADLSSRYFKKSNWKNLRKLIETELAIDLDSKPQDNDKFAKDIIDFNNRISRNILLNYLYSVYEKSGATEKEKLDLLYSELNKSDCEILLANQLYKFEHFNEAATELQEGYEKFYRFKETINPFILADLFNNVIGLRFENEQQPEALALLCERFFTNPTLLDLERIHESCITLKIWDQVKPFINEFLFNGITPQKSKAKPTTGPWPFPEPAVRPINLEEFTFFDKIPQLLLISSFLKKPALLKLTIEQNQLLKESNLPESYIDLPDYPRLLEEKYPSLAVKAWKHFILYFLENNYNSSNGLNLAMEYLNEAKKLYKAQKKQGLWDHLIYEIKQNHQRKKTFMKRLSAKSFIEF